MEKANLNNPPMGFVSPPSYDQATGSFTNHPPQQRSAPYPQPPPGFVPADNYPNVEIHQQQPIYPTNYPQQQQGYEQQQAYGQQQVYGQQPQPTRVVIIQNQMLPLGPREVFVACPHCHTQKLTRIEPEPSCRTHTAAAILCILGFWCCACLPYCMDSCMNVNHYCGNCNRFLGVYNADEIIR